MNFVLLKNTRIKRGVTQKELAEVIGCDKLLYSLCEQGLRALSLKEIKKIKEYLNLSDDEYKKIFLT